MDRKALTNLERVTTVRLSINHLHDVLADLFARLVAITPVVGGAGTVLADVKVLGVVYILVRTGLDAVNDAGFEVDQNRSWYVSGIVALVVKDILAIAAFGRKVLEVPILVDPVLLAQLLPELAPNLVCVSLCSTSSYRGMGIFVCSEGGGARSDRMAWLLTAVAALAGLNCDNFSVKTIRGSFAMPS